MSIIRSHYLLIFLTLAVMELSCSGNKGKRPSPLTSDSTVLDGTKLSIRYSSPGVKERTIWDELVPYGEVWRTGANEATVFETSNDILVEGKLLEAGKYALFTIPTDSTWTIIFNEEWDQWGAYNYDADKDVFNIKVTPTEGNYTERMSFKFVQNSLHFNWENLHFQLSLAPVKGS